PDYKPFRKPDFKSPNFHIHEKRYSHGNVKISSIQVSNRGQISAGQPNDWSCRAWLTIENNGKALGRYYFDSIEALGMNPYGLVVPHKQPSSKYFIVEKLGDYQSRLFLIGREGKVTEIHGGDYFLAKKSRYLFVQNYEAEDGVTEVFDL